jgi:2-C-methyl-D-erythritol 4-phosphate cytidylyltransferase
MGSEIPKQFLLLNGIPILMHTLMAFEPYAITLVLPDDQRAYWAQLCEQHDFLIPHHIVSGGATRFQSVSNGLQSIPNRGLVAIHDGVRPLVGAAVLEESFELAGSHGSAIAAVTLKDSIREVTNEGNKAQNRANYRLIQTPQTFDIRLIKEAYLREESSAFTDDASVLESYGRSVHLFEGSYTNIKITNPEDLNIAAAILRQ